VEVNMTSRATIFALALCSALLPQAQARDGSAPAAFEVDARVAVAEFRSAVEAELLGDLAALRTLAATRDARVGEWERIKPPLSVLAASIEHDAAVWFARPDGRYFSVEKDLTDQNLHDRAYFPTLLAGRDVVGALIISKSTGKRSVVVATPIMVDGKMSGALGVSLDMETLSTSIDRRTGLPENAVFYALDASGQTALHRVGTLIFEFPGDVGGPTLGDAVKRMLAEPRGVVNYSFGGTDKTAVFERSASTGWVFVLGMAGSPHSAPATP
jgi:methyl-accepting chemotaxis protein